MVIRRSWVSAAALVVAAVVGFVGWRALTSDDGTRAGGDGAGIVRDDPAVGTAGTADTAPGPAIDGAPPPGARASGPGTCAFLSVEDIGRAAGGVAPVELRDSTSPAGGPGCQWLLGPALAPLDLELDPPDPAGGLETEGDPVEGPWAASAWSGASRSLYVDEGGGQAFVVQATDDDPDRARQIAVDVALLVAARN